MGACGGVFSPSCHAIHSLPSPLVQQQKAAQGHPGRSAAGAVHPARADRQLLGSDLPRASLGAAPALGRLSRPVRGRSSPGGLAAPARACSGIARRPLNGPTGIDPEQPWPMPLRRSRLLGLRGSGQRCGSTAACGRPGHQPGRATSQQKMARALQSGQARCRYVASHISSGGSSWASPRSDGGEQLCSPAAVRKQRGSCTVATCSQLAG